MSIFSKIAHFFDGHVETSDNHVDASLRTHYYKSTKDKAIKALEEMISKNPALSLVDVSKERGEVAANTIKGKRGLLIITIINAGPFKTSVDLSYSVDRGLMGSFGHRLIQQIYHELDSQLPTTTV